jgi:cysteinyl-tRNA synthetase
MDDDFNTPQALAALFELVTQINRARDEGVSGPPFERAQATLRELLGVLGFTLEQAKSGDQSIAPFVDLLIRVRADLRKAKQFALADQIRNELTALGVQLEDSPTGTTWRLG